jgi:hypothetical protein
LHLFARIFFYWNIWIQVADSCFQRSLTELGLEHAVVQLKEYEGILTKR